MTKIQLELSEKEDNIVEVYKILNRLKAKQEATKVDAKRATATETLPL